jgi:hypothetical protein
MNGRRSIAADEKDATSRYWRSRLYWQRGELRKIKRRMNKRERREGRREIEEA